MRYDETVEEELCFGWINSTTRKLNKTSKIQYFSKRKPGSNWSWSNKEIVERLINQGLMTKSGQLSIDLAKEDGSWYLFDTIDQGAIPEDLQILLNKNKKALNNFNSFSASSKRKILEWIIKARKPETRMMRIKDTVELAAKNINANQPIKIIL